MRRPVLAHSAGDPVIRYNGQLVPEKGGPSSLEELFFVSGVLAALDAPNEWYSDGTELYLWAPGGQGPSPALPRSWVVFEPPSHTRTRHCAC